MIFRFKDFIKEDAEIVKDWSKAEPDALLCHYNDYDARAFGYSDDKLIIGGESSSYHYTLSPTDDRTGLKYPGRLWLDKKIMSFYTYSPKEKMQQVLNDIKKSHDDIIENGYINVDGEKEQSKDKPINWNDGWRIEIIPNKEDDKYWDNDEIRYGSDDNYEIPTLIPLEDYVGSQDVSPEIMGKAHLDWRMKDELKKKGWGKGWGSDLTAWDSKNPLAWRQAKYQENKAIVTNFKLYESPDYIEITTEMAEKIGRNEKFILQYGAPDSISFSTDEEDKHCIVSNIKGVTHSHLCVYQNATGSIESKFTGRIWLNTHIISFWNCPKTPKRLKTFMDELQKELMKYSYIDKTESIYDGTWFVEDYEKINKNEETYNRNLVEVKEFMQNFSGFVFPNKEQEYAIHLLSYAEKQELKKKGWGKGWGSDMTAWDSKNPLAWRQAKYQENLNNKYDTKI